MLTQASPYHIVAANLRENGYHVMPVGPGTKVPGQIKDGEWRPMGGWQKYCDTMPPEFIHDQWERLPDAGVCVAHGKVIGLDLDTDRKDVEAALHNAVEPSDVRRRGQKGWMGYYRPGDGLDGLTARVRWYDPKDIGPDGQPKKSPVVELLLHGTQSVLPPTIHPDTGDPYRWVGLATLEDTPIDDLPVFTGNDLAALDREFGKIGLTRQAPTQANIIPFIPAGASVPDLEKPYHRSVNDRAMEPDAIDQWFPLLGLPKSKQTGHGSWRAVPEWRPSGSGRAMGERNPNLGIHPTGIRDFARDESYTPISLIMAARRCGVVEATDWLEQYIRAEERSGLQEMIETGAKVYEPPISDPVEVMHGDYDSPSLAFLTSSEPKQMPDITEFTSGILTTVYDYMREGMRREWPEAAMLVSLNVCGIAMGRNFATWSDLRSNLYTVVLAKSGWGKSSIYNPAVELMIQAGMKDCIGAEKIQSDSAIITEISQAPEHKKIFFLDEFGHTLQRCYAPGAGGHARGIITEFTNLYSKAQGFYGGRGYADGRDKGTIENPHLNIFGMATPRQFWDAFSFGAVEDGTLPRFSVLSASKRPPRRDLGADHFQKVCKMRDMIAPMLGDLFGRRKQSSGNIPKYVAVRVMPTAMAEDLWRDVEDRSEDIATEAETTMPDRDFGGILARVAETTAKIALIIAVSRNHEDPVITEDDIVAGRRLAWYFAHVAIRGATIHVADNPHEAARQKILEFIRSGENATRTRAEVVRRAKLPARDLESVMASLIDGDLIARDETARADGKPGRGKVTYTALKE